MEAEAEGLIDPDLTKAAEVHIIAALSQAQPDANFRLCGQLHQAE